MKTKLATLFSLTVAALCSSCGAEPKSVTADVVEQHLKAMGFHVPAGAAVSSFIVSPSGVMDGTATWSPSIPRPFGAPQKPGGNSGVQYLYDIESKKTGVKIAAHIESGRFFFFVPQSGAGKSAIQDLLKRLDAHLPEKFARLEKKFESAKTDAERKDCREKLESIHLVLTSEGTIIASPDWPTMDSSFGITYGLSDDGRTSLMIAAGAHKVDRVLALLQKGADPKAKTKDGNTALHFLCEESHGYMSEQFGKIAAALIEKGADPNAKNDAGRVPLDLAHTLPNGEMAKFMREHGAKWR